MKKQAIVWILAVFTLISFSGCDPDTNIWGSINGSGNLVNVEYSFDDFEKIEASHAIQVTILPSDTFYVLLRVDDNIVKYLDVYKSGDWLILSLEDNKNYNHVHLEAEIHLPKVTALEVSGASVVEMAGFNSNEDFLLDLSGASVFSGNIDAEDCDIELSGASVVNMNGSCDQMDIIASGASVLSMGNFICHTANVNLSGASDATIHVTDFLSAVLSGASILRYYGDPEIGALNTSGASSIIKL